jgi:hypothetical protein
MGRGPAFTEEEYEILCKAWVNVSEDPINGADQTNATFWGKISAKYDALRGPKLLERSEKSLKKQWATVSVFMPTLDIPVDNSAR